MRNFVKATALALSLLWGAGAWAVNNTFTDNGNGTYVDLPHGTGFILMSGSFGSGTITLNIVGENGTDYAVDTWTATPDPNPVSLNFGAPVRVRVVLSGATTPSLYVEIRPGDNP